MVELFPYQKAIVKEIVNRRHVLVVAPMGAGKTLSTLTAVSSLIYTEGLKNIIIIAPKRVANSVWQQEAESFGMPLNVRICKKALDIKLFLLEPKPHKVCVVSVTRIEEIPHGCWDMVITDESTLFGNKTSKRSKEARRICSNVKRRVLLTGTPIHGGYEKLWHQIFLLDGGKALGKSLTAFRQKYMRIKYQVMGVVSVYEINPDMINQLHDDIRHLVYVVKDSIPLPPIMYENIWIDLPTKRLKEYKEFEETSVVRFMQEGGTNPYKDEKSLVAFASSARGMKLRQLASGCVYADETNTTYSVTHTERIEALKEIRETYDGGLLIAYQFKSELAELRKAFPSLRTLDSAADIKDWNDGKIDMAAGHPASLGHGLNLQFGGNVAVWYSLTYDAELYSQFNKRLHRKGVNGSVSVLRFLSRGTIDEKMLKVLEYKEQHAENFNNM